MHSIILLITKHAILENKDLFLLLGVILVLLLRNLVPFRKISVSFRLERRQVSAKFRDNKEQNSTNFVCITFAQYCTFGQHNRTGMQMRWIAYGNISVRELSRTRSAMHVVTLLLFRSRSQLGTWEMGNVKAI